LKKGLSSPPPGDWVIGPEKENEKKKGNPCSDRAVSEARSTAAEHTTPHHKGPFPCVLEDFAVGAPGTSTTSSNCLAV